MAEFVEEPDADACEIQGCDGTPAVRLDVPWDGIRDVCTAHGRTWAQKEGVVALPIEQAKAEWDEGSGVDEEEEWPGNEDEETGSGNEDGASDDPTDDGSE
ncbi:hypothetical protein BRD00_06220 [Halobacteriales archaeon QS_8_69_26]|nr:MAG: hypothetical protein BRD00_06220 [Halobacteriales archaeon QS_8_69_26]